jgi:aspartyl-tRNA(Asn)/glutamyl-tRNA(Gln) amidotransferase subunit B
LGEKVYDNIAPRKLLEVIELIHAGDLSSRGAKDVLMFIADGENGTAREVAVKHTLIQQSDTTAIESLAATVIVANSKAVGEYKSGKSEALKFLIGQVMRLSKGSANPSVIEKVLKSRLD